ncbi:hypothetical protein O5O45_31360 [Hahella aquimaris]|uniref:hypothetical protein n=1 Tax=Hahella sp. HNIBRBA332 TaxID=3015983 RepID=UPI00273B2442|nr:hypothetical protein [Hahella sp. HNIBRBA332]WLQ14218.1 hypothetical protein O5O45_31360 [Hahella sp. HNIBRBA332]
MSGEAATADDAPAPERESHSSYYRFNDNQAHFATFEDAIQDVMQVGDAFALDTEAEFGSFLGKRIDSIHFSFSRDGLFRLQELD